MRVRGGCPGQCRPGVAIQTRPAFNIAGYENCVLVTVYRTDLLQLINQPLNLHAIDQQNKAEVYHFATSIMLLTSVFNM